ncbi:MAG: RagB/SusD family nutrient uptake outer membrane protein [Cytophagaceae bacterium]|nr:RagB/SusD family nutrient uptake outer membrane protein [Cytophagaceae bacterium]
MNTNKLRNKVRPALFIGVLSFASFSCTNLEDVALDKLDKSGASASAQLTSAFNQLGAFTDQANIYALQEHSTDEMQGPTRGTDWDDAGRWRNIHTHTWNGQSSDVVGAWDGLNRGHALANEVVFASGVDKASLAQALFIRSFYVFHIMDLFGQVPFKDNSGGTIENKVLSRKEAAAKIIADLTAALPDLPAATTTNTGRGTKAAAQALIAKVQLNMGVYNADPKTPGTIVAPTAAELDAVIANCDAIINSGVYKLTPNYFDNFSPQNTEKSTELIFAIASTTGQSLNAGSSVRNRYYMTTHYNQNPSGWNGFTTLSDFYNSFEEGDSRKGGSVIDASASGLRYGWLAGIQYDKDGKVLTDRQGSPLNFTADCSLATAGEKEGIRGIKYAPDFGNVDAPGNDYVFFRYADVVMMKAEALFRKNDKPGALALVNQVRTTRGAKALTDLTDAALLAERGREFYWEGWRRNDQIRFGKFNDPVVNRSAKSDGYRVLYPIPQKEIEINPNLKQNAGY